MPRDIDHLVVAVDNLEAARANWQRLGFTVTPVARQPFGTANAIIQMDESFIELLAIADPGSIQEAEPGGFSFAAFNRDFLRTREGASMLALKSQDADGDRADFEALGLPVFNPCGLERSAMGPDGVERKIAFSLTYTRERRLRDVGFFTCRHHHPETFWRSEFQKHQNSAQSIDSVVLVTRDPADFHEFITQFSGQHDMISTSLGVTFDLGDTTIEIMSPIGFQAWFGESCESDPRRLLACRVAVESLGEIRQILDTNQIPSQERMGAVVVPPAVCNGLAFAFVEKSNLRE